MQEICINALNTQNGKFIYFVPERMVNNISVFHVQTHKLLHKFVILTPDQI